MIQVVKENENGLNRYKFIQSEVMTMEFSEERNLETCVGIEIVTEQELDISLLEGVEQIQEGNLYVVQGVRLNQSVTGMCVITPVTQENPVQVRQNGIVVYSQSEENTRITVPLEGEDVEVVVEGLPIRTVQELQSMNITDIYYLENDIDCSRTRFWNGGLGFRPLGTVENRFTGFLDGNGKVIKELYINRPEESVSLFGYVNITANNRPSVKNIAFENCEIIGDSAALCLSTITANSSVTSITLENVKANGCNVVGDTSGAAGLFSTFSNVKSVNIKYCYFANGEIFTKRLAGGICLGASTSSGRTMSISECFFTGKINVEELEGTSPTVGGIVGTISSISNSTASSSSRISGCYTDCEITYTSITNTVLVGGITGSATTLRNGPYPGYASVTISGCYTNVTFNGYRDSSFGVAYGKISQSSSEKVTVSRVYFNKDKCNQPNKADTGLSDEEMKVKSSFVGFSFGTTWDIAEEGVNYPYLINLVEPEPPVPPEPPVEPAEPIVVGYLKLNGQKIPFARIDDPNLILVGFTTAVKTKGEIYSLLPATTGIAVKHSGETKRFKIN